MSDVKSSPWPMVKLGEVCPDIVIGGTPPRGVAEYFGGPHLWVSIADMANVDVIVSTREHLSDAGVNNSNAKLVRTGSLLFSFKLTVGRTAFAGSDLYTNEAIAAFPPSPSIELHYLRYALSRAATSTTDSNTFGARMLNKEKIMDLSIPAPPVEEQRRIAAKLDAATDGIRQAEKALTEQRDAARALRAAIVRDAFDPATHPAWPKVKLDGVCAKTITTWNTKIDGLEYRKYVEISGVDPDHKVIVQADTVVANTAPSRARNVIRAGDVIVATTRPNLNAVAVVPPDLDNQVCSTGFAVLRPDTCLTTGWLYWSVRSPGFVRKVSSLVDGAMYPAVTDLQVRSIDIPIPMVEEQRRIAAYLDQTMQQIDRLEQTLDQRGELLSSLRSSILDAAFRGEI